MGTMTTIEDRLGEVMNKFKCGVKVTSQHDETENKWCVETVGLHSNRYRHARLRFYGLHLLDVINSALDYDSRPTD